MSGVAPAQEGAVTGQTTGAAASGDDAILEVRDLTKNFVKRLDLAGRIAVKLGAEGRDEIVHAVDGANLRITNGEVVGLVGEFGVWEIDTRAHGCGLAGADARRDPVSRQGQDDA